MGMCYSCNVPLGTCNYEKPEMKLPRCQGINFSSLDGSGEFFEKILVYD